MSGCQFTVRVPSYHPRGSCTGSQFYKRSHWGSRKFKELVSCRRRTWIHIFLLQWLQPHLPDAGERWSQKMPGKPSSSSTLAPHESFVLPFTRYLQITRQLLNTNVSTSWFTEAAVRGLSDGNCRILKLGAGSRCRGTKQGVDSGATWGQRHSLSGRRISPQG